MLFELDHILRRRLATPVILTTENATCWSRVRHISQVLARYVLSLLWKPWTPPLLLARGNIPEIENKQKTKELLLHMGALPSIAAGRVLADLRFQVMFQISVVMLRCVDWKPSFHLSDSHVSCSGTGAHWVDQIGMRGGHHHPSTAGPEPSRHWQSLTGLPADWLMGSQRPLRGLQLGSDLYLQAS